ncbi:MAG: sigma 54-interacting transcriptional regulator [Bacteroidota bacterium]
MKEIRDINSATYQLFRNSPDPILVLRPVKEDIIAANLSALDLLGYSEEELLRLRIEDVFPQQMLEFMVFYNEVQRAGTGRTELLSCITKQGHSRPLEISASIIEMENESMLMCSLHLVTENEQLDRALRQVMQGTLMSTEDGFFHDFVRQAALVLKKRYAFVTQVVHGKLDELEVIAIWGDGSFMQPFTYSLEQSPCQHVVGNEMLLVSADLKKRFPEARWLSELTVESYWGIPLFGTDGVSLGHFVVMNDTPMEHMSWMEDILKLSSGRLGPELGRKKTREALNYRFALEGLISEVSNNFMSVVSDSLDKLIVDSLSKIAKFSGCERSYIYTINAPARSLVKSYEWIDDMISPGSDGLHNIDENGFAWLESILLEKGILSISDIEELPAEADFFKEILTHDGVTSSLNVPIMRNNHLYGILGFDAIIEKRTWSNEDIKLLRLTGEVFMSGIERVESADRLKKANEDLERRVKQRTRELSNANTSLEEALLEVKDLKDRLQAENIYLKEEIKLSNNFDDTIGESKSFRRILKEVEQVGVTDSTVLLLGETGTGKEIMARSIHEVSKRSSKPLVKVNCAALPANLIESELFGHEKGAFTGAFSRNIGRFELADGGTIFLDEVGELPLELQSKLLRVLQEGEFERLGSAKTIKIDVRVITATNRNLEEEVKNGNFRSDLFYRLNVFPIQLPPLRERQEDIPALTLHFIAKYGKRIGKNIESVPKKVMQTLLAYSWPGNIRELENVVERALITSTGGKLELGSWFGGGQNGGLQSGLLTLQEMEKEHISEALQLTSWRVSGEKGAAKLLGMKPTTLEARMKKLGISRPK